ncbi:MAG: NADH dehydrogenase [Coxiella sp. RIFCSPHIGHO2_12_FULL_42_15]|nr:MAG: NADH dehydrogenase [Coxiella sp. RIFCSPHIGHO2_12_FULL_42_15]
MVTNEEKFILSDQSKQHIDHWLQKYPPEQKQSAVVEALFVAQEQNGYWLSEAAMNAVAEYLALPPIVVYEAATFYDLFNLKPIGKHKIAVCTNVSCMLRGSEDIVACLEKRLGIHLGETTEDGLFTLKEVECMAACANAPMCQIDDKTYHVDLTPQKMVALVDEIVAREKGSHG